MWNLLLGGRGSQRKSWVARSSGNIWNDSYRVECLDENYTLSTHFPYTLVSQIHTKLLKFKTKHPFHTFYEMCGFNPSFCVYTLPHNSAFSNPFSTHKFGRAGYSPFCSTCLPEILQYVKLLQKVHQCSWTNCMYRVVRNFQSRRGS